MVESFVHSKKFITIVVVILVIILIYFIFIKGGSQNDPYTYVLTPPYSKVQKDNTKLPLGGPWKSDSYLTMTGPSMGLEKRYHDCLLSHMSQDGLDENGIPIDPTLRYDVQERCYIRAMKHGTTDVTDLICQGLGVERDGHSYHECLSGVYSNYSRADRFAGVDKIGIPLYTDINSDYRTYPLDSRKMRDHETGQLIDYADSHGVLDK
jgi:hypothetical protein